MRGTLLKCRESRGKLKKDSQLGELSYTKTICPAILGEGGRARKRSFWSEEPKEECRGKAGGGDASFWWSVAGPTAVNKRGEDKTGHWGGGGRTRSRTAFGQAKAGGQLKGKGESTGKGEASFYRL